MLQRKLVTLSRLAVLKCFHLCLIKTWQPLGEVALKEMLATKLDGMRLRVHIMVASNVPTLMKLRIY